MKRINTALWIVCLWILLAWCSFFWWDKEGSESDWKEQYDPCSKWWGFITLWEYWNICKFADWSFCSTMSFLDWTCKSWDKYEDVKYTENNWLLNCSTDFAPVCWEDWNLYLNECFLERQDIKPSTTLVEKDWGCVEAQTWSAE